jgi:hypothetical protein
MAQEDLDGFERVHLRDEAASKRSSPAVAAVSATKSCRSMRVWSSANESGRTELSVFVEQLISGGRKCREKLPGARARPSESRAHTNGID